MVIKNPNPRTNWKPGDVAYIFVNGDLQKGRVTYVQDNTRECRVQTAIDNNWRPMDELFETYDDALITQLQSEERLAARYESEIDTVEDLLYFALEHDMSTKKATAKCARRVFKNRVLKLLGIEL